MNNPVITWKSTEMFSMWDDCLSFPWLFVKVRRHKSISVDWISDEGKKVQWSKLSQAISELLQHEIDHLDGFLPTDRAVDSSDASTVNRKIFEQNREEIGRAVQQECRDRSRMPSSA
eukprot:TRINITY_DN105984_c0_g1_i1.p1 TRINITY_DN105984_c0_g1~~TRINITY_DN105984_c0_g1_i1.p1  ORF type:complete len:117 (-),score=16.13 TRINITY_DN105984_c0_g1_i1:11-361(-)